MSMHYQALDEEASNVEVGVGAVSPDCQVSSSLAVQPGAFAEVYQLISANALPGISGSAHAPEVSKSTCPVALPSCILIW
ncbi:hypothetical protein SNOG_13508 [Parastagonospora nodorum SN15]|uniref:Uncharacterized protein n=1 Tax=Phaeosphaeria nodorum (strain SN15 / ATCC MYA-4574 / FGSC 10173) TaxID=321614 RepID=Q0U406_PHANO|nr:hypothetical protein SNOG_13508 [Parastagonospora nodorum SN15]EAT78955.1 hypothetical protein SNOG_13508 [Parastagonospora nodorum SN15]